MIRKLFLITTIGIPALAASTELRDVRLSSGAGSAQVTLIFNAQTPHKLFTLEAPDRVVIDLTDTRLPPNVRAPEGTGPVEVIRFGERPKGALRVVVQLKSELPVRSAWMPRPDGAQLIIDLGTTAPAPLIQSAAPQKSVRAIHAPVDSDRDVVVAVDAGHGGQDPGATGRGGTREKDVVLKIARALAERIDTEPGMRAILTRQTDQFLTLRERIGRARAAQADLFISVHADSIRNRAVSGASVYVLSERGATDEQSRWLAERENAADLMGGVTLTDKDSTLASVLMDLSQSANISASMSAAQRVLTALDRVGEVRKPQVQQAGFVVLKSPDIPSMLVETAYISNPFEEKRLKSDTHQDKLASAIFTGLRGYFERNPPPGTRFASLRRAVVASVTEVPAAP